MLSRGGSHLRRTGTEPWAGKLMVRLYSASQRLYSCCSETTRKPYSAADLIWPPAVRARHDRLTVSCYRLVSDRSRTAVRITRDAQQFCQ